ncbi:uncharacterized protein N7459_006906 [Penicillium hispanicum]|uniref:uncharacterized protein n=1 Tax=Penicillium hispanicum TaxID=1080232 RepID=UPI0025405FE5|nr:uncharacterized protein N7459_006906 [Penicillium hispanicum]KAJ5577942.1 hypothetical protein N7459_006906 [Penicillium hispanicum]
MRQYQQGSPSNRAGISHGSSTGAPGDPLGSRDTRASYNPATEGYNPATGASYTKSSAGGPHQHHHQPASPPDSYDQTAGQDARIQHAPSTVQRARIEDEAATNSKDSRSARAGEGAGKGVKGAAASIHVRCSPWSTLSRALTSAVDRAFGSDESAERNEEIARRGEREVRSGEFMSGKAPRRRSGS